MLNDFRKSIQSVLYERVQSPVSGAFFFSWIVWNWKLIFYLIFSNVLISERINFVQENYINIWNNLIYPFASTVFLIVIYPFITTAGYWVWLKFKTWQINIRNDIEKNQLLTLEQSITIRMQIRNQETEFDKMLTKRDDEIELLKRQFEESYKSENPEDVSNDNQDELDNRKEFYNFEGSEYYEFFDSIITAIVSHKVFQSLHTH